MYRTRRARQRYLALLSAPALPLRSTYLNLPTLPKIISIHSSIQTKPNPRGETEENIECVGDDDDEEEEEEEGGFVMVIVLLGVDLLLLLLGRRDLVWFGLV